MLLDRWRNLGTRTFALSALTLAMVGSGCGGCGEEEMPDEDVGMADTGPSDDMGGDMVSTDAGEPDMGPVEPDLGMIPDGEEVRAQQFVMFPPVPTSCEVPNTTYRLPFAIPTDLIRPAVMGDFVAGLKLVPNETFDLSKIVADRVRISQFAYESCSSDTECSAGFRCISAGLPDSRSYCTATSGATFTPNSMRQDYDPGIYDDSRQLVSVLIENTAGAEGRLPTSVGGLYGADGQKDLFGDIARASDPGLEHREAIGNGFMLNLASVVDPARSRLSIWTFAGDKPLDTRPFTEPMSEDDHFTANLSLGQAIIENQLPSPLPRTANLFQAILEVIDEDLGRSEFDGQEKFLLVHTDGYNEVYDEDATPEAVRAALEEHDIHLFILHLDTQIDDSLLRDLPSYWGGSSQCRNDPNCAGAPPCGSDDDCLNFETCRKATVYPEDDTGTVSETSQSYCMPKYTDGRLGPIEVYADLACQTGGNYVYLSDPRQLTRPWREAPFLLDGQWSVEVDFSAMHPERFIDSAFYLLSGVFAGGFGNSGYPATLAAPPADDDVKLDTRKLIRFEKP